MQRSAAIRITYSVKFHIFLCLNKKSLSFLQKRNERLFVFMIQHIVDVLAEDGTISECSGWTNIFIYPGYKFKVLDALITNFHLPQHSRFLYLLPVSAPTVPV